MKAQRQISLLYLFSTEYDGKDFEIVIIFGMTALYEPWPSLDFLTTGFLQGGLSTPRPTPNPEDQAPYL
jgi:hypothetical protein